MKKHPWVGKEIDSVFIRDKRLFIKIGKVEHDIAGSFNLSDEHQFSLSKDNIEDIEKNYFNGKEIYAVRVYDGEVRLPKGKRVITFKRMTISIPVIKKKLDNDVDNTLIINYDFKNH